MHFKTGSITVDGAGSRTPKTDGTAEVTEADGTKVNGTLTIDFLGTMEGAPAQHPSRTGAPTQRN